MPRYRPVPIVVFAIVVSALVGGLFGKSALAVDDKVPEHYKTFTAALAAIEANYVSKVESDNLVYSAIRGMLGTLDPHSSFFSPVEYARMRERQEGRYYGIGIQIVSLDGDVTATRVFEGSPAYKAGVRRGDIISRIAGDNAKGWSNDQAMQKLRGSKGTNVAIEIRRRGYEQPIPIALVRDEVTIPTVTSYFMIDATTGYVRMQDFGENTDRDVKHALRELSTKGMKRLLFDIRGNPGGPLDQAIKVANEFLPRGRMIVYTRGRVQNSDQDYRATDDGEFSDIPVVMMANRNSASASEIVTGALQDHDRAYIVGETTFGKALVQSVYRVSGQAGLALTTAHYYTPSGRLIQRPWDATFDEYSNYSLKDQDVERVHNASDLKRTDSGRPVYSGGGIDPDKRIAGPVEGFNPGRFGRLLYNRQAFESYAQKFMADGDSRITQQATGRVVVKPNFVVDDAMLADFREQLKTDKVKIDEEGFKKDEAFIRAMIRFRIDEVVFGIADAQRHLLSADPQSQMALSTFGEAVKLIEILEGDDPFQSALSERLERLSRDRHLGSLDPYR